MIQRVKHFYEFGQFHVDEAERLLLRNGQPVPLAPKVFDTLLALVKDRGHILEKERLMKELWPDTFVEESNLTYNISQLRKALGEALESVTSKQFPGADIASRLQYAS